jgi:hypothetical protein
MIPVMTNFFFLLYFVLRAFLSDFFQLSHVPEYFPLHLLLPFLSLQTFS